MEANGTDCHVFKFQVISHFYEFKANLRIYPKIFLFQRIFFFPSLRYYSLKILDEFILYFIYMHVDYYSIYVER